MHPNIRPIKLVVYLFYYYEIKEHRERRFQPVNKEEAILNACSNIYASLLSDSEKQFSNTIIESIPISDTEKSALKKILENTHPLNKFKWNIEVGSQDFRNEILDLISDIISGSNHNVDSVQDFMASIIKLLEIEPKPSKSVFEATFSKYHNLKNILSNNEVSTNKIMVCKDLLKKEYELLERLSTINSERNKEFIINCILFQAALFSVNLDHSRIQTLFWGFSIINEPSRELNTNLLVNLVISNIIYEKFIDWNIVYLEKLFSKYESENNIDEKKIFEGVFEYINNLSNQAYFKNNEKVSQFQRSLKM